MPIEIINVHGDGNLRVGDKIEAGIGADRECGTVQSIDGDKATIAWAQAACVTTQPISALDDLVIVSR